MKRPPPKTGPAGSNSAPLPIPGELCPEDMALLLKITRRTLTNWERDKIIEKRGRNFPTVETIQRVLNYFQSATDQKSRKLRIEADIKQIELDLLKRNLISLEEQEDWLRATIGLVIIDLLAIPSKSAKNFPELDAVIAQERLNEIVEAAVSNLFNRFTHTLKNVQEGKKVDSE
jgi:transcriptional regulator with XRE-family HTH domain